MKQIKLVSIAIILLASVTAAQDRLLTIDDIFSLDSKVRVNFAGTPTRLTWARDGRSFRQATAGKLLRVDAVTGESRDFFDARKFQTQLEREGVAPAEAAKLANAPGLQFDPDEAAVILNNANDLWHYNTTTGAIRRLTNNSEEEQEPDFSPDGRWVSFVRGNNIFVVDVATGREKQLTRDGAEKILNGYLDWIYQEELYGRGNFRAYWWSPDSKYIAFLRLDESPVPKFVLTNDIVDNQVVENTDYPQAGDPNPLVRLGIADITKSSWVPNVGRIPTVGRRLPGGVVRFGDAVKFVNLSKYTPEDLLIARVAWTPDSKTVMFQALNREQTFLDLNAARLDGTFTNVLQEKTPAWVEVYDNPEFLGNGTALWQSARDGWRHLYLYDSNGKLIRQLTSGDWEIRNLYGVDEKNGWAYFSGTKDSHIAENVYRVRIADGTVVRLTQGGGVHSASFDPTFAFFIDSWSDARTPSQQRLYRADGTLVKVINENPVPALAQFRLSTPEFLKVKTRDGFEMEAMMIKPPDFDPAKKYPVLQYTYAGPHAPSVADRWGGSRGMWHHMLAQKGYIIWVCDNRTASGKGEESVWPGYKNFMVLELQDIEDGVSYLKSLPYVDGSRIGIWGWSFGGMMTSYALTHSKAFKMGIAGGTVGDWRLYDSIYTERYMLQPKNNPEGFARTSVIKAAGNLNGKLLLIHGGMDDNVHMQNTMQLAYELQKANKQFDLMIYPTQRHGISNPAQVKHWYTMMTDYVTKNL
ncbi:MAG: S9 family peptidase [Blastocatellia bacterium]|nr:S9 family peptidase [Blastocatellia bacterium]